MVLPATKGPASGRCNICGDVGVLTRDHTPPKGCVKPTPVVLHHAIDALGAEPHKKDGRILQDGVSYRTLCSRCNSGLLGGRYDPVLIDFSAQVVSALESRILLQSIEVKTKPQLLFRSIFGHLAAQGVDRYLKGPHTADWAAWFLAETLPMPARTDFYCWPYPYKRQSLRRDAVVLNFKTGKPCYYWLMKFYPIAFCIWHEPDAAFPVHAANLSLFSRLGADDEAVITMPTYPVPHELVLEAPNDDQASLWVVKPFRRLRGTRKALC
jgi:hypothetical protein